MRTNSAWNARSTGARNIFPKLAPRPNGPPRRDVIHNQRGRISGALVEAARVHGLGAVTVSETCRLAGISKRTFYEQFPNKQACVATIARGFLRAAGDSATSQELLGGASGGKQLSATLERLLIEAWRRPNVMGFLYEVDQLATQSALAGVGGRSPVRDMLAPLIAAAGVPAPLTEGVLGGIMRAAISACYLRDQDRRRVGVRAIQFAEWTEGYDPTALRRIFSYAGEGPASRAAAHAERRGDNGVRARLAAVTTSLIADGQPVTFAAVASRTGEDEHQLRLDYIDPLTFNTRALELARLEAVVEMAEASKAAGGGTAGAFLAIMTLIMRVAHDGSMRMAMFPELIHGSVASPRVSSRLFECSLESALHSLDGYATLPPLVRAAISGGARALTSRLLAGKASSASPASAAGVAYFALAPLARPDDLVKAVASLVAMAKPAGRAENNRGDSPAQHTLARRLTP